MKMKTLAIGAVAGLIAAGAAIAPAHASDDWDNLRSYWSRFGVAEATQERLIDGLNRGAFPDSFTDAAPVNEKTLKTETSVLTIRTFADGSISTTGINASPASTSRGVTPLSVSGCTVSSGSGYRTFTNCKVEGTNGNVSVWFYANYTLVQGAADYISWYGSAAASSVPGSTSKPFWSVVRLNELAGTRAQVSATTTWSYGVGSQTYTTSLGVGGDSAVSSFD